MRPQQDFSRSFCSCCCPQLLSCSFLVPLGLLSHCLSTSLVVFLCFLFPPLVRIALLPVVCFPPSLYFLSYFMLNMASGNNSRNRAQIFTNIQKSITPDCFEVPTQFLYHQKAYGMHFS